MARTVSPSRTSAQVYASPAAPSGPREKTRPWAVSSLPSMRRLYSSASPSTE